MSAIIENKWDMNHIQTLPNQDHEKVLWKILQKGLIIKKCIDCKTSHISKIDVFILIDGKIIVKCFNL